MRQRGVHGLVFAIALLGATSAAAIELQVIDQDSDEQTSPPAAQAPGCRGDAFNTSTLTVTSSHVGLETSSHALLAGSQCGGTSSASLQSYVTLLVTGAPGAAGRLCGVTRFDAATPARGSDQAAATADLGGDPYTDPGGLFLNGNPLSSVLRHFDSNDADAGSERALFTVTVGDQIRLAAGTRVLATLVGSGDVKAEALVFAGVYRDVCPVERAPVASPRALLGLALALAALGGLLLRSRRAA